MRRFLSCLAVFVSLGVATASAQQVQFVDLVVETRLVPEKAILFISNAGKMLPVAARILPLPDSAPNGEALTKWMLAGAAPVAGGSVTVSALVEANSGEASFFPPRQITLGDSLESAAALRARLLSRKEMLSTWKTQLKEQFESLRRLRDDADTIADFGRILDAQDELTRSQVEFDNLGKDIENLQKFLVLVKNFPEPRNLSRREGELTRQLSALSAVAKKAETSEGQRAVSSEVDLQRKLEIVESTKSDDIELLQHRLFELRRERERRSRDADAEYGNQRVD